MSSKKPKVLIVATHPVQYQVPWFRYLHKHLSDYQFEVLYLTIPDADKQGVGFDQPFQWDIPMFEGYCWSNVKTENLSGDLALDNFFSLRLKNTRHIIRETNPDALLLTGWQCLGLIQVLWCARGLKIPCLIRAESNNLKPRAYYKSLIHRLLLSQFDKYLSIGTANRDFYLANGVNAGDIFSCPYFVDNKFFKRRAVTGEDQLISLRSKWRIAEKAFCFCYVGKLSAKKHILDILHAFQRLNDKNTCLLIVGSGDLMREAKAYVNKHTLNVRFAGFLNQSQLPIAYSLSHCLILASDYDETWGLVVNEAMASGLPAIVSRRSGCHLDLIQEGITGYTFEFANIDELARKMRAIKSLNKQEYQALSRQAQLNLSENYSMRAASAGLHNALVSIL